MLMKSRSMFFFTTFPLPLCFQNLVCLNGPQCSSDTFGRTKCLLSSNVANSIFQHSFAHASWSPSQKAHGVCKRFPTWSKAKLGLYIPSSIMITPLHHLRHSAGTSFLHCCHVLSGPFQDVLKQYMKSSNVCCLHLNVNSLTHYPDLLQVLQYVLTPKNNTLNVASEKSINEKLISNYQNGLYKKPFFYILQHNQLRSMSKLSRIKLQFFVFTTCLYLSWSSHPLPASLSPLALIAGRFLFLIV